MAGLADDAEIFVKRSPRVVAAEAAGRCIFAPTLPSLPTQPTGEV